MPNTAITFGRTPLPNVQWTGDADALLDLIATHLTGDLVNGALVGQVGGSFPLSDVGFYFNNFIWYSWNAFSGQYLPNPLIAGRISNDVLYYTTLQSGAASGNVTLTLPDANGATLATTEDIRHHDPTTTITGANIAFDTTMDNFMYVVLVAHCNITVSGMADGQRADIWVENPANQSFNLNFTNSVVWFGGVPDQSPATASSTTRYIDHYTFYKVGTILFGEYKQGATILTTGGGTADTTAPLVTNWVGNETSITLTANELLIGALPPSSDFVVQRTHSGSGTAVTMAVSLVFVTGNTIKLTVTPTTGGIGLVSTDTVRVTFNATSQQIKDLANNPMGAFAAHIVSIFSGTNATETTGGGFRTGGGGQNKPY